MFLFAFDLLEPNSQDLRRQPKRQLASLLRAALVDGKWRGSCPLGECVTLFVIARWIRQWFEWLLFREVSQVVINQ